MLLYSSLNGVQKAQGVKAVYDSAAWSSIVPLSAWSVANESNPIKIHDYTFGSYKTNAPVDIEMLRGGGNTNIKSISISL